MVRRDLCYRFSCDECQDLNRSISTRILELQDSGLARKTHYFNRRFENIYIAREHLPGLQRILETALQHATRLLKLDRQVLRLGFWFNIMQHGDVTLPHTHDDNDELLSGTYYLQIPADAGALVLHLPAGKKTVQPEAGRFVLFHPQIEHEVTQHRGQTARISIGFNIGIARDD